MVENELLKWRFKQASHEACGGTSTPTGPCPPEPIDLSDHIPDLVQGVNILAVQVHSRSLSSSDFLFIPALTGRMIRISSEPEPDKKPD